jgi:acyl-CoA synthetase (AMP-forming)/AMP-acid ligase II
VRHELLFGWEGFAREAKPGAQDAEAKCVLVAPGKFEQSLAAAEPGHAHDDLGAEVSAAIALKEDALVSAEQLREYLKERVADNYPRHIWFVEELPKGPTGKILKRQIQPPSDLIGPAAPHAAHMR